MIVAGTLKGALIRMARVSKSRKSARWGLALVATTTMTAAMLTPTPSFAAVVEPPSPPFDITIFPQRDFVSVTWDSPGRALTFDLTRGGVNVGHSASDLVTPALTTDADGLLEVNHPGGLCWAGSTPDILPGDTLTVLQTGTPNGIAATTLNITADPAITNPAGDVVITGRALNADGTAMDLAMIEQRIISPGNLFDVNGRRNIRATSDGASLGLIEARPGVVGGWVATYSGLSDADVARAIGGETRGMAWQAVNAAGDRLGITIYEAGVAGGPGMPECPAAAENSIASASPGVVNAANVAGGLSLSGASFNATNVTITLDDANPLTAAVSASAVPASPTGASAYTVNFTGAQIAGLADGVLTATSSFVTSAGTIAGSGKTLLKDTVVPLAPTTDTAPGTYPAAQSIRLSRAAGEDLASVVHYTTDGSAPTATSPTAQPIAVTSSRTVRAVVVDPAGNVSPVSAFAYTIAPPAPPAPAPAPGSAVKPLAPGIGAATSGAPGGARTAMARWMAPKANGAVIDGYQVRALLIRSGRPAKVLPAMVVGANARRLRMSLRAGQYRFQVRATSAAGDSAWSAASNKVASR